MMGPGRISFPGPTKAEYGPVELWKNYDDLDVILQKIDCISDRWMVNRFHREVSDLRVTLSRKIRRQHASWLLADAEEESRKRKAKVYLK
ncbi:hypothetical protein J6590_029673 [Homalodisca vitripennis]|nr:hypothetical protein J6590_029673 [Homalodisca vitripennis]